MNESAIPPVDQPWYSWFSLVTPPMEMSGRWVEEVGGRPGALVRQPRHPDSRRDHDHAVDVGALLRGPRRHGPAQRMAHHVRALAQSAPQVDRPVAVAGELLRVETPQVGDRADLTGLAIAEAVLREPEDEHVPAAPEGLPPEELPLLRAVRQPVDEDDGALGLLSVCEEPAEARVDHPVPHLLRADPLDLRDGGVVVGHGLGVRGEARGRGGPERHADEDEDTDAEDDPDPLEDSKRHGRGSPPLGAQSSGSSLLSFFSSSSRWRRLEIQRACSCEISPSIRSASSLSGFRAPA
jgi:hypothetical protein